MKNSPELYFVFIGNGGQEIQDCISVIALLVLYFNQFPQDLSSPLHVSSSPLKCGTVLSVESELCQISYVV